jgi:hypothetical protein
MKAFIGKMFALTAVGMLLSGIIAYAVQISSMWAVLGAFAVQLVLMFVLFAVEDPEFQFPGDVVYFIFCGVSGIMFSGIFVAYPIANVISAFFIASALFTVMAVIGYTTKKDLSGLGGFFMMALIGLIIVMIVSIFISMPLLNLAISYVAVLLFCGLTAYDMQMIKKGEYKTPASAALAMYLNLANLAIHILAIMGGDS